jgi:hypothetical protein
VPANKEVAAMSRIGRAGGSAALIALLPVAILADEFRLTPLDDFEDASPWVKGDPNTDLTQKDAAVAPSTDIVKQGKQSLAFMISVNWTPRPGEQYAKGWPMISRIFEEPRDWRAFDRLQFWLYTETEDQLPGDRVLRCGVQHAGEEVRDGDWYTLPGIRRNEWQLMSVPFDPGLDWTDVTGVFFYVAEQWYRDGDRVTFYIDDMQLAARTRPALRSFSATSRIFPRGARVGLSLSLEGDPEGSQLRWQITDPAGRPEAAGETALEGKQVDLRLEVPGLPAGGHYLSVEPVGLDGQGEAPERQFLRTLQQGKRTYLSLITFYTPWLLKADPQQLAVLNDSAYAGVAIPLWGGYYTGPVPEYEELGPKLKEVREALKIDPWPWVFLNRFIGAPEDARGHAGSNADNIDYFRRINILDLDNETGARSDMMAIWRLAVRAAKEWGSPGIVLDMEAYSNYPAYQVSYVAERRGEPVADVIAKCEAVGADLARICEEEYPECIVWSLFSRLDRSARLPGYPGPVYPTVGHMTLGFLKYAKEHAVPCKYLCGGEVTVGYYNPNVEALKGNIARRDANMSPVLARFPDHLFLAGTISPYHDHTILTSWIKDRAGDEPELRTIADFQPMFRTLFDAYDWVWVYASSAGKTVPYNPENSRLYSEVLSAALDEATR